MGVLSLTIKYYGQIFHIAVVCVQDSVFEQLIYKDRNVYKQNPLITQWYIYRI